MCAFPFSHPYYKFILDGLLKDGVLIQGGQECPICGRNGRYQTKYGDDKSCCWNCRPAFYSEGTLYTSETAFSNWLSDKRQYASANPDLCGYDWIWLLSITWRHQSEDRLFQSKIQCLKDAKTLDDLLPILTAEELDKTEVFLRGKKFDIDEVIWFLLW